MAYYHGIKTSEQSTALLTTNEAGCGIPVFIGTAPIHTVGGEVNVPIQALSDKEARTALGYSDNWGKYTLCEAIYSQFTLYGVEPAYFINVLDPVKHSKQEPKTRYQFENKKIKLPYEVLIDTLVVTDEAGETTYTKDVDYAAYYDDDNCIVEFLPGGAIVESAPVQVTYTAIDPSKVTSADIIGGYDLATGKYSGIAAVDLVFPKYRVIPDLILAPGWSHDSEVAAVMESKAQEITGIFRGHALIDVDSKTVTKYSDVPAWKNQKNIMSAYQQLYWPMVALGGKKYHLSTQNAGLMGLTDIANGDCPSESQSNKNLKADSIILADGTTLNLTLNEANYLNQNGICTALNFIGGYKAWGNETAAYPENQDVKDYMMAISRTFKWCAKSFILSYWAQIDKKITPRFVETIVDSFNIYLNNLTAQGKILGGRIEFTQAENSNADLMAGKIKFHVYLTPPSAAKEIEAVFEYDVSYLETLFK